MMYYHCSPAAGIRVLEPRKPLYFPEKPACVYLTTLLPMALMYGVQNFEYTYGYTREKKIYFEEFFPDSLEYLYSGKSASLYICEPGPVEATRIPNEYMCRQPVPVVEEIYIPDLYRAMLEQQEAGMLDIHRYADLTPKRRAFNMEMEVREILEGGLLHTPGPKADYMKAHYPQSWELAMQRHQQG